jgi:hypothetical protein
LPSGAVSIAEFSPPQRSLLLPALAMYALAALSVAIAWGFHSRADQESRGLKTPAVPSAGG